VCIIFRKHPKERERGGSFFPEAIRGNENKFEIITLKQSNSLHNERD
jgi:hypothetical protein